ncbi:MAG TPA: hypothetical protein VFJ70_04785 [Burkholderiales bacterium]|nr:hypothetical protein [Burkholderiales bacterium]
MRQRISIAVMACALAACAAEQAVAPVDNSPANPTAVVETVVTNGGIMGMFPFEATEKLYVRSNMRRDDHSMKGTGTFSGYLVNSVVGGADSTITRLDNDRLWMLNHRKKEYRECPAHGCPRTTEDKPSSPEQQQKSEPKQKTEEGCTVRIASSHFDVKSTGQKKSINGFDTSEYQAAWVLKLQDPQKRSTTSTLSFDVWTTPLNAQMREALAVEQTYGRAYVASQPRAHTPSSRDRAQVMPPEVTKLMLGYLASLSPADRAAITNAGKQLAKIQGHPILTHIEWRVDGNACGAKDSDSAGGAQPSASAMLANVTSMFGKKDDAGAASAKPVLDFTVEVKALKVEPVRDSVFAVPSGYKRAN